MSATESMLKTEGTSPDALHEAEMGKKIQGKCLALACPATLTQLYCCYVLITVLSSAVVGLSVALSVRKPEQVVLSPVYAACPGHWTGFGNKCFYFSEDTRNWTHSQAFCKEFGAELAWFENLEELRFLKRYKGSSDHWIGLYRKSAQQPWKWTDHTDYHNLASIQGVGEYAYLNVNGISSARDYGERKWTCSKPNSYTTQCLTPSANF